MYSRSEKYLLTQEFWSTFGKWSTTKRKRLGLREKWLLNKTGVRGIRFRFSAERKQPGVHMDITEKFNDNRTALLEKIVALKSVFVEAVAAEIIWDLENPLQDSPLLTIQTYGLTPMNKENWPAIFKFFYTNMLALEMVFEEYKDYLEG
jgi:hypothetical protein